MTSSAPRPRHITGAPASTITVRVAEPPDRLIAITVLVGAFSVPPLAGWIDPNSMTRYGYLIEHVAPLVSDAITRSAVYLATDAG